MRMGSRFGWTTLAMVGTLGALGLASCAQDIVTQPRVDPGDRVTALFDPSLSIVPTPTDLIKDRQTGLLAVPVADATKHPAQAAFDHYLNSLDGFPDTATAMACFGGELDKATVATSFKVIKLPAQKTETPTVITDVTASDPVKTLACPILTETPCDVVQKTGCKADERCIPTSTATAVCAKAGWKVSFTKKTPWERGASYAFYITNKLHTKAGKPLIRSLSFQLATAPNPLCVFDTTQNICTYNYSTLLASQIKGSLVAENAASDHPLSQEDLDKKIRETILKKATDFEMLRRGYSQLLAIAPAAGIKSDDVILAWNFSVVSLVEASFNPATGVIPGPGNDLVYDAQNKKVAIPATPGEKPAEKALREGLNTLDGFSTTASYFAPFSGKLDATQVKNSAKAVDLIVVNLTNPKKPVKAAFAWVDNAGAITFTPTEPLDEGTKYAVVLRSRGNEKPTDPKTAVAAVGGLADATGRRVVASTAFALARTHAPLVDKDGKSQVSVLDDATAAQLEPLRAGYDQLLTALENNPAIQPPLKREDVAVLWTFTTQTITKPLMKLRALPYSILGAKDSNKPAFVGGIDPTLASFPPNVPKDNIGGLGKGVFTSWNALDPQTGAFRVDPTKGKPSQIPFYITLPKLADCSAAPCADATATCATLLDTTQNPPVATAVKYCVPAKFPVVVVQHGLTRQKEDFFAIANTLAKGGYAVVAFDIVYHGERSVCASDTDCKTTATCSATTHQCCDKTTPTDCGVGNFADRDANGVPDVSGGAAFLNTQNPFAIRDNLRQHVIDASAFLRALRLGAASGLKLPLIDVNNGGKPVSITLDSTHINLVSQSLGSILSTLVLATDSSIQRAVLNVPGAPVVKIFATTPQKDFAAVIDAMLKAQGLCEASATSCPRDSAGALKLFHILQWIVDPGDPANFAKYIKTEQLKDLVASQAAGSDVKVTPKDVIVQLAGKDSVIPVALGQDLARWMGVDVTNTTYPNADHGFLFSPKNPDAAHTGAAQAQALKFLLTGTICKPDTTTGQCN